MDPTYIAIVLFVGFSAIALWRIIETERRIEQIDTGLGKVMMGVTEKLEEIGQIRDYLPEFTINQNPLQAIFDAVGKK